jgi:hypothetical protein
LKTRYRKAWITRRSFLVGETFGRLTVYDNAPPDTHGRRWKCRCKCGNTTEVSTSNLTGGNVVSCGCALKGSNAKRSLEWVYNRLVTEAKKRGYAVSLTYKQFMVFTKKRACHYCKAPIVWGTSAHNIDRKNNTKGYSKENCVVCCKLCNWTKSNRFTYEQFVKIGRLIGSFYAP